MRPAPGLVKVSWMKKISFFRQHLALGRTGRYGRPVSASSACCGRARCIRTRPASPPPSSCSLVVHRLALERLEEGFRERVVPWVARPRHGLGDSMGLEAALERPGSVLGTLVVVEGEAEVARRALPSDRLPERIRDRLLGHAPGHRPAHGLPMERVNRGCEAGPPIRPFRCRRSTLTAATARC